MSKSTMSADDLMVNFPHNSLPLAPKEKEFHRKNKSIYVKYEVKVAAQRYLYFHSLRDKAWSAIKNNKSNKKLLFLELLSWIWNIKFNTIYFRDDFVTTYYCESEREYHLSIDPVDPGNNFYFHNYPTFTQALRCKLKQHKENDDKLVDDLFSGVFFQSDDSQNNKNQSIFNPPSQQRGPTNLRPNTLDVSSQQPSEKDKLELKKTDHSDVNSSDLDSNKKPRSCLKWELGAGGLFAIAINFANPVGSLFAVMVGVVELYCSYRSRCARKTSSEVLKNKSNNYCSLLNNQIRGKGAKNKGNLCQGVDDFDNRQPVKIDDGP